LIIASQPDDAVAGQSLSALTVQVQDQYGNLVIADNSSVTVALTTDTPTLNGTRTVTVSEGIATFSDLSVNIVGTYSLAVTDGSLTADTSASFDISHDVASQLVISTQPADTVAGQDIPDVVVSVEDQFGNLITDITSDVTIAIASGTGTLNGGVTVTSEAGMATFDDLSINQAGDYTLSVTDGSLTTDTSSSFTISPDVAAKLEITTQPGSAVSKTLHNVIVAVEDQFGNVVTSDSSNITLARATGTGTLNGTKTVAALNGVAVFSGLSVSAAGTYSIAATDGSLDGDTSDTFTIGAKLVISTQPTTTTAGATISTINIQVKDSAGHIVTTENSSVTIAISSGPNGAEITGTQTVDLVNGVASFTDLSLTNAGSYKLTVTDGAITAATSSSFTVNPGIATQMVLLHDASAVVAGKANAAIKVQLLDTYGNVASNNHTTINATIGSGPNGAALTGTIGVAPSSGVATFSNLVLKTAGTYTIHFASGSLSLNTSSFTVSPAAANKLIFSQPPVSTTQNANISPSIVVDVTDTFGNLITTSTAAIKLALSTGPKGATMTTLTVNAVGGHATFASVSFSHTGSYKLKASATGLTLVTSGAFTITPTVAAPATH
jgi:hypothetical protein